MAASPASRRQPHDRRLVHHRHGAARVVRGRLDLDQRCSPSFAGLTSFSGSNLTVSGGATVSLRGSSATPATAIPPRSRPPAPAAHSRWPTWPPSPRPPTTIRPPTQFEALAGGTVTPLGSAHDQYRHRCPGERRHQQRAQRLGPHRLHRGQRLDDSTLQASNGGTVERQQPGQPVRREREHRRHGGEPHARSLTSYGSGNITVSGGATLSLPGLTGYTGNGGTTTLEATGAGSTLTLANLATITEAPTTTRPPASSRRWPAAPWRSRACTRSTPAPSSSRPTAQPRLNVSALTGFTEANGWTTSTLQATNGGTVSDGADRPLGRQPHDRRLVHDRHGAAHVVRGGSISINGGSTELRRADFVQWQQLTASGGATVSLPGIISYAGNGNTTTLEATGTGSTLTLANLATVTEAANNYQAATQFEALAGGTVALSGSAHDQYRHRCPGERRHQQRAQRLGAHRLHRGQRLDDFHSPGLQWRHGRG